MIIPPKHPAQQISNKMSYLDLRKTLLKGDLFVVNNYSLIKN